MKRQGPRYRVPFRRRREGRTNYRTRARLLRSGQPRAVIRKTLRQTIVQLVEAAEVGDRILAAATSIELTKRGWSAGTGNLPAAYLTGLLAGKRAVAAGVANAILDIGLNVPAKGGRVFAALQGLLDSGLSVPHSPDVLPSKPRLRGEHIGPKLPSMVDDLRAKLEAG